MKRLLSWSAVTATVVMVMLGSAPTPATAESGVEIKMPAISRCVGVLGGADGSAVVLLATCPQTSSQFWLLTAVSPGNFEWVNESSGKCMTASGMAAGSSIIQSTCTGGGNQIWRQANISGSSSAYVVNQWSFGCLGHMGLATNVPMTVQPCSGAFQQWLVL